jgi:predicted nucleic acid-binding protein
VLDSSALIAAQRGSAAARAAVDRALDEPARVVLPTIALLEFRAAPRVPKRWHGWLDELVAAFQVVPLNDEAALRGARIVREMGRRGRNLSSSDAAVLGCGLVRGATVVVTADRDFDGLPEPFTVERVGALPPPPA